MIYTTDLPSNNKHGYTHPFMLCIFFSQGAAGWIYNKAGDGYLSGAPAKSTGPVRWTDAWLLGQAIACTEWYITS